jgi:hypothetical protein
MHARTRPDNNLQAATEEGWVIDNSPEVAIAALVLETRPTVVPGVAIRTTEEVEGIALAIDKSRIPQARPTGARLVEHLPARVAAEHAPAVRVVLPA